MTHKEIAAILASAGLRPQHKFGQNFMVDQNILRAIADSGDIQPHDIVLEVGPGVGNLTRLLAQRAHQGAVLAVDIDTKLLPAAQRHHAALTNITWLNADVLAGKHEINPAVLAALRTLRTAHPAGMGGGLKLVSNLPYNAASPIIAELLVMMWHELQGDRVKGKGESIPSGTLSPLPSPLSPPSSSRPEGPSLSDSPGRKAGVNDHGETASPEGATLFFSLLAFTVQYEVAERMRAKPDTSDYGPLGILIQLTSDVSIERKIPPGAFWPPPKVNSALVLVRPDLGKLRLIPDILALQRLLTGVFGHRRQTLHNALKHYLADRYTPALISSIESACINLKLRPEVITQAQFLTLTTLTATLTAT
jgi:16S rRNA A1518/A1519 N6-dimethyltransferase RsmA/KsgA/DIM1 with predicted DNA glycosylase/AP lyase activity